jgi:hypothetical protein
VHIIGFIVDKNDRCCQRVCVSDRQLALYVNFTVTSKLRMAAVGRVDLHVYEDIRTFLSTICLLTLTLYVLNAILESTKPYDSIITANRID